MFLNLITDYKPRIFQVNMSMVYKLSSNENALGASQLIIRKIQSYYLGFERYPSCISSKLIIDIAKIYSLNKKRIVLSNESNEFIRLLCAIYLHPGAEAIMSEYASLVYKTNVLLAKAVPVIIKELNGRINISNIINSINTRTKLIFITSPSDPMGIFMTLREIGMLANILAMTKIILILDMAYSDYVTDDRYANVAITFKGINNIVIIKTLSKIYGLATFRTNWMLASKKNIALINKVKDSFGVNEMAREVGAVALSDSKHYLLSRSFNMFWITKVIISLREVSFTVYRAYANFIIIKFLKRVPIYLIWKHIADNGIILKDISEYKIFNSLRMTIGLSFANVLLIRHLVNLKKISFILMTCKSNLNTWRSFKV